MNAQQERIFVEQTSEALHIEAARITERARADVLTATAQADFLTATARAVSVTESYQKSELTATAFLPMATLQAGVLADREAQREHEAAQPTRALLMAQIESESKYGGWRIFGTILVGSVFLAAVVLVGWLLVRPEKSREDSEVLDLPKIGPVIEPTFERTDFGKWERVDPIIPCTAEQLADFAEAVVDGERQFGVHGALALAFGPREGYILFREWLAGNGFTEPAARAGEVQPSLRGLAFLRVVVTTGSPPPPYQLRVEDGEQPGRSVLYGAYTPEGERLEGESG